VPRFSLQNLRFLKINGFGLLHSAIFYASSFLKNKIVLGYLQGKKGAKYASFDTFQLDALKSTKESDFVLQQCPFWGLYLIKESTIEDVGYC